MRGAQTIRRWPWLGVGACLLVCAGCPPGRKKPTRERRPQVAASAPTFAGETAPRAAPELPLPVQQALREVHEKKAVISAPREDTPRLSFGKGRLVQATPVSVVFRDTKDGAVLAQSSLGVTLAVAGSVDGSLFALGLSGGVRLEARASKPKTFAHVGFFPGAALFPDLEDPSHFYVYYDREQELFHYSFEAEAGAFLPIEDRFPLADCTRSPALLRDGAFVCITKDGLERRAPRGSEGRFKVPAGVAAPIRLLPTQRLDELFALSESGEVVHLRLEPEARVLGRFQLPAEPFAAAGNSEVLSFVLVTPPSATALRRFRLLVTDLEGQTRFEAELESPEAPAADDWLRTVIGDKNLAISSFEPLVAVGGADSLRVWNYAERRLVFTR